MGDALGDYAFERFKEISSSKGRRSTKLEPATFEKRATNTSSFRYLTNDTEREFRHGTSGYSITYVA